MLCGQKQTNRGGGGRYFSPKFEKVAAHTQNPLICMVSCLQPAPSSILVWEILWTEEPAGLQSMGS